MEALEVLAIWAPSGWELLVVLIIALLLFGKRLPEVARSLGKGIVEFKKGVKGVEDEIDQPHYETPKKQIHPSDSYSPSEKSGEGEGN